MRYIRFVRTLVLGASVLLMTTVLAPGVLGQEDGEQAGHPVVGAWIGDPTPQDPADPMELYVFTDEGTMHGTSNFGPVAGTWESTGERTHDLTFALRLEGGAGMATVRSSGEVSEDGQTVTATYTVEFPSGGPFPEGQLGPAEFTAQRINLEQMGEPVGPLELPPVGAGASPGGSPAASPGAADASPLGPAASPVASPDASPAG